jgi:hypothetical protein
MEGSEKTYWLNQNLFRYQDPNTSVQLSVSMDSGISIEDDKSSYLGLKVSIQLKDNRTIQNGRIKFEMDFDNMTRFVDESKSLYDKTTANLSFTIQRFLQKSQKDMIVNVISNNNKTEFSIKILDPLSQIRDCIIYMDSISYSNLCKIISNVINQYTLITTNTLIALNQERTIGKLNILIDSIGDMSTNIKNNFRNTISKNIIIEEIVPPSEKQTEFMKALDENELNKISIPSLEDKKEKTNIVPKGFISGFLHDDIKNINAWTIGYTNSDKASESINSFILNSNISSVESNEIMNNDGFKKSQLFIKDYILNTMKNYLDETLKEFPNDYPIVNLHIKISKENSPSLYSMIQEQMVVLIVYNKLFRTALDRLSVNNDSKLKVELYKRAYFIYKVLCSPLFVSLQISNKQEFMQEMNKLFTDYSSKGAFKSLEDDYSQIAMGGEWTISSEMFSNALKTFMKIITNTKTYSYNDIDNLRKTYNLNLDYNLGAAKEEIPSGQEPEMDLDAIFK